MITLARAQRIGSNLESYYFPNWLSHTDSNQLLKHCSDLPWQSEALHLYGRAIIVPRKIIWMANSGINYTYSGKQHIPIAWTDELTQLRERLSTEIAPVNSVLGNYYKNGQDYMGWHADNEPELGTNPIIMSISLGAERTLKFRHNRTKEQRAIELEHGSLLVMMGQTQSQWQHSLPKRLRITEPRINLTFRYNHMNQS